MKIVGLIAEYNPFHNGHQYHIEKAKEITGADAVIVVMSGNFVQRGAPAIMPKHLRAEMALKAGASLVLELPVCYATGTAEQFAYGAVSILNSLGCVEAICFGSECGDINVLSELTEVLCNEPVEYKDALQKHLRNGLSFPLARQKAIEEVYPSQDFSDILGQPNNILGIEYLKALYRLDSKMKPYTIQRVSSQYHDVELQEQFSSATALRQAILNGNFENLNGQVPSDCMTLLERYYQTRYPIFTNEFSLLLKYRLLSETKSSLTQYADVSEELANRIYNQLNNFVSFEQFCELLKTKEMTYSRISRALLHILLGIKKTNYTDIQYARVLGFRKDDSNVLTVIKNASAIPLLTKLTATKDLSDSTVHMLNQDIYASNLYESVVTDKLNTPFINEHEQAIKIV
ncbi:MAG: nucleotidyltransferase [Tyzzerella sp.]|nr:nucleotidyltransferase [Tyzzerella sp.]